MKKAACVLLFLSIFFSGCHPFFMFKPQAIVPTKQAEQESIKPVVDVAVDGFGIPFIKGSSLEDTLYGLGYMHARDRLFQLDLLRHAAQGRTSELFGEKGLFFDKKLRILTYRLDEQVNALSPEESHLLDSYVRGVNQGAKERGRTAEHFLLGMQFEAFIKKDVIAIARLQTWQLASDLLAEITRLKIARSSWSLEAKQELLAPIDDRGSAILSKPLQPSIFTNTPLPDYLTPHVLKQTTPNTAPEPIQTSGGASNAWAVEARLSTDGYAMLMNDPHLIHAWPSNFYLATMQTGDFFATGATFVGLPGILIGSSKNLSWGITASYLNTQDSVYLTLDKEQKNTYIVDGKKIALEPWPQSYCLGKTNNCKQEMLYTSMYGPVVTHDFEPWIDQNDMIAVQWTGFQVEQHPYISYGFIKLASAKTVQEGVDAIKSMTLPGVNILLADTQGSIAYAYAGIVPKRHASQHNYLPLDGRNSLSRWSGFLNRFEEPFVINPASGFLVTANQNIFPSSAGSAFNYGQQGAPPYRAQRIKERIESSLMQHNLLSFDELSTIQLDDMSLEAKELAPLLGSICVDRFAAKDTSRKAFAQEIKSFDGRFSTESRGALPYDFLTKKILSMTMADALDKDIPDRVAYFGQVGFNVKDALYQELTGKPTAIFKTVKAKNSGLHGLVGNACEAAYQEIVHKAGSAPWKWRYGRHHYLQRQSLLAKAPVVGGFFKDKKRSVAGTSNAPMAESGIPVIYGANLRFRAKMSNPPELYAVIDSGNSGTVGDKHALDQAPLWHAGKSIRLPTDWAQAAQEASAQFKLVP